MNKRKAVYFGIGLLVVLLTFGFIVGCGSDGGSPPVGGDPIIPGDGAGSGLTVKGKPYNGNIKVFTDDSSNGSSSQTTQLTFIFDQELDSFAAANVTLSGVDGVTKGTMSYKGHYYNYYYGNYYDGHSYELPISGFTSGGSLTVKIGEFSSVVYISVFKEGIYLGIIKFAGDVQAINGSSDGAPVFLSWNSSLSGDYTAAASGSSKDGSAVYYAVHKALANLKSSENKFPVPDSVYIITFTDGKDNGSSGLSQISPIENQTFTTTNSYITYVQNQIANRKIQNKNITAYSIGVKGSDIVTTTDQTDFTSLLQNIAGSGNNRELTDYSAVQTTFDEIADGLIQGSNFTLSTTLLESGTKVRMTFDNLQANATQEQINGSAKYIEGTVNITGSGASLAYTFTNITYGGITSDAGTGPLTGERSGTQVNYLFSNITGYNYATDRYYAKQWLKAPSASEWTINSEYTLRNTVFGTAVIYLVLDCSSSISNNIDSIRTAVNNFITKIYNARYSNY